MNSQNPAPVPPASPARVRALLMALGDTAEDVAATLLAGGHSGDPGSACGCPVAMYLAANGIRDVSVDGDTVSWSAGAVSTPAGVGWFVCRFDGEDPDACDGEWPELRDV